PPFSILFQQTQRRLIMIYRWLIQFHLLQYLGSEFFAKFHAPLIKGKYIPNHALSKNLVFIHRHQPSQTLRREFFDQNGVGGPLSTKFLIWCQKLNLPR